MPHGSLRSKRPKTCIACRAPTTAEPQPPSAQDVPSKLDKATLAAVKQALESLFQEQSVVTMPDVRVWLSSYTAAPKAQQAARLRDDALASLLLGGGSILCIRCDLLCPGCPVVVTCGRGAVAAPC